MVNSGRFPQGKSQLQQSLINYKVHAGSFRVSVIHRARTWTTGPLACVRDHSCACVYTPGGAGGGGGGGGGAAGAPTTSQHNIFDSGKTLTNCPCAPDWVWTSSVWLSSPMLYPLSHPVTLLSE